MEEIEHLRKKISELENEVLRMKSIESDLIAEKEKYESLISNIPGVVYRCECHKSWKIHFISDHIKVLSGYSPSDFIDNDIHTFSIIIHPEDKDFVEKTVFKAIEEKIPFTVRYRVVDSDHNVHWVYEKGQAAFGSNKNALWLDGVIFDISDIVKSENKNEELIEKLKSNIENTKRLSGLLPVCPDCEKNLYGDQKWYNNDHS